MAASISTETKRRGSSGRARSRPRVFPSSLIHCSRCGRSSPLTRYCTVPRPSERFRAAAAAIHSRSPFVIWYSSRSASTDNLFHVTRPDGSCLTYEYMPYFSEKDIVWNAPPKQPNRSGYSWKKGYEYGNLEVRYDPFVAGDVVQIDRDATVVGHTQRGEPVYELKDPNHPLLKGFYKDYEANFAKAQ